MGRCRLCFAEDRLHSFTVRELALGLRETFLYEHCQACGSLQIAEIPTDLSRYYLPSDYYAYREEGTRLGNAVLRVVRTVWWAAALFSPGPVFACICAMPEVGSRMRTNPLRALRGRHILRSGRIADVGGATGATLAILRNLGYRHLTSIDPFGPESGTRDGIRFIRGRLPDLDETFDLIMYHHSLEHVPDLDVELLSARSRLAPSGLLLVRTPLLPNDAFDQYGANWVEIDAPRHLHVPSRFALRMLAERCGLEVVASGSDTQEFEFWGSEEYQRDIARPESLLYRGGLRVFLSRRLREQRRRADRLNAQDRGGRGWFLFRSSGFTSDATGRKSEG